jgi:hypothetical protein
VKYEARAQERAVEPLEKNISEVHTALIYYREDGSNIFIRNADANIRDYRMLK